jgi:hypothetical protein
MTEELQAWVKSKAQAEHRSMNNLIVLILQERMAAEAVLGGPAPAAEGNIQKPEASE